MKERCEDRRKDIEILKAGNSDEASEENAEKPSIGVVDAQEEDRKTDEEKESGKEAGEVVSRSDHNSFAGIVGICGTENGMKADGLRLARAANGQVDGIARGGMGPKIFEGVDGSELDAVDVDDLVTGAQARLIGRTVVLNVVNGDAGARGVKRGFTGTIEANFHRMVDRVTGIIHPDKSVDGRDEAKNRREEIEERTRERVPRAHGNTIVRQ